jgi:DNA invertase Pin-like site-specific DNA recombinase
VNPKLQNPARAVLYTRVSTDQQAASGLGLEAQLAACREHARRKGYAIVGEFSDPAVSGRDSIEARPGLQSALALSRQSDVVVIVYSLSRLSRRQSLTWALLDDRGEYRLLLESASESFDTTTSMGRAMLGMMGVWNALEADLVSERTKAALQARRARGHRLGPRTTRELNPELVRQVVEMYANGTHTHKTLAERLNALAVPTIRGKRWHPTQVGRVLREAQRGAALEHAAALADDAGFKVKQIECAVNAGWIDPTTARRLLDIPCCAATGSPEALEGSEAGVGRPETKDASEGQPGA